MSIFELKVLWAAQLPQNHDYDAKHLAVGLLDHETEQRIAVANFSGLLRIFRTGIKYSEHDMIFETDFGEPIVQIRIGTFIQNIGVSLGVLFLKRLTIMAFAPNQNGDGLISKSIQIALPSPCFSFLSNPLLSTSINSLLHYLSPPSTVQIKGEQPIYAVAQSQKSYALYYMDGQQLVMMNSSIEQWRVVMGQASAIHIFAPNWVDQLVCVGSTAYWVVDENSNILESKHIENEVSCSLLVPVQDGYNIVLGMFSQHVCIYHKGKLIWVAKCDFVPIAMEMISVAGRKGFLVMLSDTGQLEICYLGTDVPMKELPEHNLPIDYKDLDQDIARLESIVDQKSKNLVPEGQTSASSDLKVMVTKAEAAWSDQYVENREKFFGVGGKLRVLNVELSLELAALKATNIKVYFSLPSNLWMAEQTICFAEITSKQTTINAQIYAWHNKFPYTDTVQVSVTYYSETRKSKGGQPKFTKTDLKLPFNFQAVKSQNSKAEKCQHKIILIASQQIPKFSQFYRDCEVTESGSNITFTLSSKIEVSIVASKNSSKYKIQSDYYEGICLPLLDFIKRTQRLKIDLSIESVPLQQLFLIAEQHFKVKKKLEKLQKDLQASSSQFRLIQKRILAKLKQKSSQLNSLDLILSESHRSLIDQCNKIEQAQHEFSAVTHQLNLSLTIVCQLLFLRGRTSPNGRKIVYGMLQASEYTGAEGWGWEEQLIVNTAPLLKKKVVPADLENLEFEKIRKTLLWIVDRTAKGEIS